MNFYRQFEKAVHKTSRSSMYLAAASLFLMMILTTCDVIGRYIFNSPIIGTQDLIELGLVLIGFSGLGYITSQRNHMRADMINAMLSRRRNAILGAACFIISLPFAIALAWETCTEGTRILLEGKAVTSTISVPLGPFYVFAGVGLVLLSAEIVLDVVRYIDEARGNYHHDEGEKEIVLS